jgi:hypothetical protein
MRFKLVDSDAFIKDFYDHAEKVKSDEEALRIIEQGIARQEKALEDHL